jgi:uncharacterized protein (DUF488 family)
MAEITLYTIGHSDHALETFVALLRRHAIALVVDVRSQPYSRWTPQFNREPLRRDLEEAGLAYRFMGDVLGGRPTDPALYTAGAPDYGRMEEGAAYQAGIEALLELARAERVAVMCSEGDPRHCHRHRLIAQTLLKRGVRVLHVTPDGETLEAEPVAHQLSLF